uniref:CWH43-like N-terminal domain-containing protein n=2 Tax=Meloidogyne incognita TaxID=6306 RepID=A0A914L1F3_MELIC
MKTTSISLKCHHQQQPQIPITTLNLQKIPEPSKTTKIVIEDYDQTTSYSPPLYDSSTSNSCSPDSSEEASTSYSDEKENNFCKNCFDKKEEIRENKNSETTEWAIRPDAKWKVRSIGLLAAILPVCVGDQNKFLVASFHDLRQLRQTIRYLFKFKKWKFFSALVEKKTVSDSYSNQNQVEVWIRDVYSIFHDHYTSLEKDKGIACYLCLAYSFTLQYDRIANFTIPSTMCPGLKSIFPPVSYSIGVWKPQKYIWLMVLALHLPPRFFYAIVYKNHYSLGDSIHRTKRWFCVIVKLHYFLLVIEALGLTAVSVIDIESNFKVHACCFALWLIPFNLNMLFNNLLHYHSGIRKLRPMHDRVFQIKCALFLVGYPLSMSTGFSYLTFVLTCNTIPYATFSIAEYFLIGINSLFYFLLIWEFDGTKLEVYVKHRKPILVRNQQRMMELRKNKLKNNER